MDLKEFNQWLAEKSMEGFWAREPFERDMKPQLWKWADLYQALQTALELVPMDKTARRNVGLRGHAVKGGLTHTIGLGIQILKPGETAECHRHVASAIRFAVKGSPRAFTIVEGERFPMEEGDLITTPNWTWHDHYNGSDDTVIWLDSLDARLVGYLNANFSERFKQEEQPVEKPDGYSAVTLGHARPAWLKKEHLIPPFRYAWKDTYPTLLALKSSEGDPFDGIRLEYRNPFDGGPTMPTLSCEIQLLRPGEKTKSHRHTSSTIYYVFRGEGVTTIEGQEFHWAQGDVFVIPPWASHDHKNLSGGDTILFSINDRPVLEVLGLYREEARG
jgi:1-hydroxy-2-naphthoate dioxygenase